MACSNMCCGMRITIGGNVLMANGRNMARTSYRVVELDITPEINVCYMLFDTFFVFFYISQKAS